MQNTLSWKLSTSINDTRTLFENEVLPYAIDTYICSCLHKEFILRSNFQEIEEYRCPICENEEFLDANYYLGNVAWYEPIEDSFSKEFLNNLNLTIQKEITNETLLAKIFLDIPKSIDISCDAVAFLQKEIFQVSIDNYGKIEEILFANFKLNQFVDEDWYCFDYPTQKELINKHPILFNYKKKILQEIVKTRYFDLSEDIYTKADNIEQISFFLQNSNLKELDFYYWKKIDYLPYDNISTIDEALSYILNNRKEKTLKKAIYENYKEQLRDNNSYYFIYPYCIAKYIKDVNIAKRLLDLDFKEYFNEIINHRSLEYFLQYLTKYFSDKQIENLFKSYKKHEIFWFIHALELFAELDEEMRDNFEKRYCKYNILHDDIVDYHRLIVEDRLLDVEFDYMQKQQDVCMHIEPYDIRLPIDGVDLYSWSNALSNCLAGYGNLISQYKTTVYGFFKEEKLSFAVEIRNNKIIQAKSKYNQDLSQDDMAVVIGWYEEFILKQKDEEDFSTIK